MPIIPVATSLIDETYSAVRLPRFAQIVGLDEAQLMGIQGAPNQVDDCHPIWTHAERVTLARYLKESQDEIERILGYFLFPKWIINEQHPYKYPLHADWHKVLELGYRHAEVIATGVAVSYVTDPSVVVHATTETDESNIRVFHPGTTIEIIPSDVSIAGGIVTIQIPRARLVEEASQNNPAAGHDYTDVPPSATSPFTTTVDIYSVHNNTDIQGGLVWSHRSTSDCVCDVCGHECLSCGEYTETACIYVRNYETSALDILPATYSASTGWTSSLCSSCYCADPDIVRVNYKSGLETLPNDLEEAVVLLALAKYPQSPCGCGLIMDWWKSANEPVDTFNLSFGMRKSGAFRAKDIVNHHLSPTGFVIG